MRKSCLQLMTRVCARRERYRTNGKHHSVLDGRNGKNGIRLPMHGDPFIVLENFYRNGPFLVSFQLVEPENATKWHGKWHVLIDMSHAVWAGVISKYLFVVLINKSLLDFFAFCFACNLRTLFDFNLLLT